MLLQKKYAVFVLFILCICQVSTENNSQNVHKAYRSDIKNISGVNWTFYSQKSSGFIDRKLYIGNATFQYVLFFSNQPFSVIIQKDTQYSSFTGMSLSKQINNQVETKIKENSKFYQITRNYNNPQSTPTSKQIKFDEQVTYFANLSIYGVCKTIAYSTHFNEIQVQITFYPNRDDQQKRNILIQDNQVGNLQEQQTYNINRVKVNIGTTVYCINTESIKQANYFVAKLYQLFGICVIGLIVNFRFLRNIPWWVRLISLAGGFVAVYGSDSWYGSLLISYYFILMVVLYYRIFQSRSFITNHREYILTKSFILVSLASAVPLAIKSHLENENIEHKRILLHIVNLFILLNILLFTQSIIHLQRFRHAFYYFILFLLAEIFLKQYIQHCLVFQLLQVQVFPAHAQSQSLFFTIMLIPLCDFFFKSYSSDNLLKFIIILLPVIFHPFQLNCSTSFAIGFVFWLLKQAIKGRDITKIIKHKR